MFPNFILEGLGLSFPKPGPSSIRSGDIAPGLKRGCEKSDERERESDPRD